MAVPAPLLLMLLPLPPTRRALSARHVPSTEEYEKVRAREKELRVDAVGMPAGEEMDLDGQETRMVEQGSSVRETGAGAVERGVLLAPNVSRGPQDVLDCGPSPLSQLGQSVPRSMETAFGLLHWSQVDLSLLSFWDSQWGLDEAFDNPTMPLSDAVPSAEVGSSGQPVGGDGVVNEIGTAPTKVSLGEEKEASRPTASLPGPPGSADIIMKRSLNDDLAKGGILRPSLWTPSLPVSPSRARRDTTAEDAARPATLDGQSATVQQPYQTPDSGYGAAQSSSMPQHTDLEAV
ncbi:uncharacterized protein IWZ02DRAFT_277374 [Phyllosticta citriasiana]|uniref:Uncharacterized protein n=1 Tax=Phyllosticta citriasiana TaxID=595635 RepID=A0ABR1L0S6_9PEZI